MTPLWTNEEISRFLQAGRLKKYPKGQILFSEGDKTNEIYFIKNGWVNVYRMTRDGNRVSIALRNKGEFIGFSEMFRLTPRDCYAEALEEVDVYSIEVSCVKHILDEHPEMLQKCLAQLSHRLHESHTTLLEFVCNKAFRRMAITFLNIAEKSEMEKKGKHTVSIKLTQEELATTIGSSRQIVNALLKEMKQKECIEMNGRKIEAVYPEKIRKIFL